MVHKRDCAPHRAPHCAPQTSFSGFGWRFGWRGCGSICARAAVTAGCIYRPRCGFFQVCGDVPRRRACLGCGRGSASRGGGDLRAWPHLPPWPQLLSVLWRRARAASFAAAAGGVRGRWPMRAAVICGRSPLGGALRRAGMPGGRSRLGLAWPGRSPGGACAHRETRAALMLSRGFGTVWRWRVRHIDMRSSCWAFLRFYRGNFQQPV